MSRPLPPGTYWDTTLERYVAPTDGAWDSMKYAALVADQSGTDWATADTDRAPPSVEDSVEKRR